MKSITTLIPDIYAVLEGNGGWDATLTKFLSEGIANIAEDRFSAEQKVRDYISPSSIGAPDRQLWYRVNEADKAEKLNGETLGTFFYGDILEKVVLALAKAAGHSVEGEQEIIDVCGVKGAGDAIIDGWVIDVKSASSYGMNKFLYHQLQGYNKNIKGQDEPQWVPPEEADPFGYISQLSSYLYGYKDDPRIHNKTSAGFLVVGKERFKLHLDFYNLEKELANKEAEIQHAKDVVAGDIPPRCFPDVEDGASGNKKLHTRCGYCDWKHSCWDNLRGFQYSNGVRWLTEVEKEPNVPEVTK